MVIYTKRGDKGKTSLYSEGQGKGKRVSKDTLEIRTLGAIDELNSFLGTVASFSQELRLIKIIKEFQKNLLTIGSIFAGSNLRFSKSKTKRLEELIDHLEGELPPLKNFIVPGGSLVAAHLQYARALTRRAERLVVALSEHEAVKPQILIYFNRFSDALFMLAREANAKAGIEEETWPGKKRV